MQQIKAVEEKKCSKCGETKPISEFLPRKVSKDGYRGQCKGCMREYYLAYNDHIRDLPPEEKPHHHEPVGMTRVCKTCGVRKDYAQFRKRNRPGGIDYSCRECTTKKEWENYSKKFDK